MITAAIFHDNKDDGSKGSTFSHDVSIDSAAATISLIGTVGSLRNQTAFRNGKLFSRVPGHRARQPHVRVIR